MRILLLGLVTALASTCFLATDLSVPLLLLLWSLGVASVLYLTADGAMLPMDDKCILITGCDTGFGNHLARHLDAIGVTVYAGCLHGQGEGASQLRQRCSSRLRVVQLDVTKDDQCAAVAEQMTKEAGHKTWAVVNNAGIDATGDAECLPMSIYHKIFNVNLFGLIRVTKALLPLIRKSKGRIVNVTSVKGVLPEPYGGAYCTSKFAAEAFSDILRVEMRKWGVKVAVVEPGQYNGCTMVTKRPEWSQSFDTIWESMSEDLKKAYGKDYVFHIRKCVNTSTVTGASDPRPVLEAITHALFSERPRKRYLVDGHGAYFFDLHCIGARLRRWLPTSVIDWFLDQYFIGDHPLPRELRN